MQVELVIEKQIDAGELPLHKWMPRDWPGQLRCKYCRAEMLVSPDSEHQHPLYKAACPVLAYQRGRMSMLLDVTTTLGGVLSQALKPGQNLPAGSI